MATSARMVLESACVAAENPWYAVRVKSHFEKIAAQNISAQGYEEYLPVYTFLRRWVSRTRIVELPLFPGYVFSRFDPHDRVPILKIPGVVDIVGIGRAPAPVDPGELAAVRAILRSRLPIEPWGSLCVGQRVFIEQGPLRGLEGVVAQVRKTYRLVVSVTLLQRSVAVEIDYGWVRPLYDTSVSPAQAVHSSGLSC